MAKALYLRAVSKALRETVLPVVDEAVARDSLAACLNILAALEGALDDSPAVDAPDTAASIPLDALSAVSAQGGENGLPVGLPDDLAVRTATAARIADGQRRAESALREGDGAAEVSALLAWERAQRAVALPLFAPGRAEPEGPVPTVGDLEAAPLQAYLSARYGGAVKVVDFRRVMGGRSRQTALFSQEGIADLPRELVVQRDPPVYTGVPGVEVQAPVIAAANAAGVRAPRPYLVESDHGPLGAPFMIMQRLPGAPIIDATTGYFLPSPAGLESVALGLAGEFAKLHAMPIGALDTLLAVSFDRADGTWRDEAASLRRRLAEQSRGPSVVIATAMAWIERHAPEIGSRWSVVHGDMLLHNLLSHDGEVSGVLDWEVSHIGHPGEDLGYVRPVIDQILPWARFMEAYAAAGGVALTPRESDFFSLYASVRLLTLVQVPRNMFEARQTCDLRLAETAASFIPQLVDRIDKVLTSVLSRDATA